MEEFCPDVGALDKSFLADLQSANNHNQHQIRLQSDNVVSDSNENGNPLVAKYHDDLSDNIVIPKGSDSQTLHAQRAQSAHKVSPLARNKNITYYIFYVIILFQINE